MMELRRLRYFVTVAEELHFSRAASRLHLTVPSLSQQIKVLEREVGTPLFERDRRHVALTDAGLLLLEHARPLLGKADRALAKMRDHARGITGCLRVGLFVSNAAELTLPIMERFHEAHPRVDINFVPLDFAGQLNALLDGRVDVAFTRPPFDDDRVDLLTVAVEPRVALMSARSELADAEHLSVKHLEDRPFIDGRGLPMPEPWVDFWLLTEERGGGTQARFDQPRRPLDDYDAVRLDIALYETMTTVPASVARATIDPSVRWAPIQGLECEMAIGSRRNDTSPLVRDFREIARRTAKELISLVPGGRPPDE